MKSVGFFEITGKYVKPTTESGSGFTCPYGITTYDDLGGIYPPTCDSTCPHFGDIERSKGVYKVNLSCGSGQAVLQTKKVKVYK